MLFRRTPSTLTLIAELPDSQTTRDVPRNIAVESGKLYIIASSLGYNNNPAIVINSGATVIANSGQNSRVNIMLISTTSTTLSVTMPSNAFTSYTFVNISKLS